MRKGFSLLKKALIGIISLILVAVLLFYVLIVWGASPRLQSIWVCTAMTTMNHKYLATWFISDEKIERILEENRVDDDGLDSELREFHKKEALISLKKPSIYDGIFKKNEEGLKAPEGFHSYIAEGYKKLEDGIYLKEVSGTSYKGYVMLIEDPLRVKLQDTSKQFEEGQTVKRMVTNAKAIAGINGGGFKDGVNYDSNGGTPAGLIIENGVLVNPTDPNDEEVFNMIGIDSNGVLILQHCTASWALENNIVSAVSFEPFLVVNGEGTIKNGTGGWGIAPRTAIGQRATGEFLFLVIDGRQIGWSIGCDLDVLQKIMLQEKAENAAMLDGGSSTVLFYNGEYVNKPSLGHERLINNSFIVTK